MTYEDFLRVPNIGEKTAQMAFDGISERSEIIVALSKVLDVKKPNSGPLKGVVICITGPTSKPRNAVHKMILDEGGVVKDSVGSGLTYLVSNEPSGSAKSVKAQKLGVKVITEQELYKLMEHI
jgi:DNA ligase (NAD+)